MVKHLLLLIAWYKYFVGRFGVRSNVYLSIVVNMRKTASAYDLLTTIVVSKT